MLNKINIIFLIFAFSNLLAVEFNAELIMEALKTENTETTSNINGTIFVNAFKTDDAISDIHFVLGDDGNRINVAMVKFLVPRTDIIIGRQLISRGSGYNFNPTDIFNSKPIGAAFDPSYSKIGRDAAVINFYFTDRVSAELIYAAPYRHSTEYDDATSITEEGKDDFGALIKVNIFDFDIALSETRIGKKSFNSLIEGDENITGISIKGSLPFIDRGIWFEGARYNEIKKYEFSTGLEIIEGDFTILLEYYRNSFGEGEKRSYDIDMLYRGRMMARDYLAPSLTYVSSEKITLRCFTYFNINDSSSASGAVFDYFYNDFLELIFIPAYLRGKEGSEFGMQKEAGGDYAFQAMLKVTF